MCFWFYRMFVHIEKSLKEILFHMEYHFGNDYDWCGVNCQNALHYLAWVKGVDCYFSFNHNGSLNYLICILLKSQFINLLCKAYHADGVNFAALQIYIFKILLGKALVYYTLINKKKSDFG